MNKLFLTNFLTGIAINDIIHNDLNCDPEKNQHENKHICDTVLEQNLQIEDTILEERCSTKIQQPDKNQDNKVECENKELAFAEYASLKDIDIDNRKSDKTKQKKSRKSKQKSNPDLQTDHMPIINTATIDCEDAKCTQSGSCGKNEVTNQLLKKVSKKDMLDQMKEVLCNPSAPKNAREYLDIAVRHDRLVKYIKSN